MAIEHANLHETPHVHFVGIGGAGMGAIAAIMLEKGYLVSGSDVAANEGTKRLAQRGARVYLGHHADHVDGADYVVYSTALSADNEELVAARDRRIPVLHRSEMLARLMQEGRGIAIAGAHGKTTTTSMVAYVLEKAGLDPTFLVGGVVANLDTGAKAGRGEYVVAEADESDRSFLNYRPRIAVVTNIEADHLEHYAGDFNNLKDAYRQFVQLVDPDGLLVTSADDVHVSDLLTVAPCRVCTYSIEGKTADLEARAISWSGRRSRAEIYLHGSLLGVLQLSVPGLHNVADALAALGVALEAGVDFEVAAAALAEFHGALRRFEVVYDDGEVLIVDDYAHHPTEIRATLHAARGTGRRIVAIFQPQRYTRTYHLFDEFTRAFAEADDVVIADIYSPAGERPIAGVNAAELTAKIRENSNENAKYRGTKDEVFAYLQEHVRSGDLVLTMGAGDIWKVGRTLAETLENGAAARAASS